MFPAISSTLSMRQSLRVSFLAMPEVAAEPVALAGPRVLVRHARAASIASRRAATLAGGKAPPTLVHWAGRGNTPWQVHNDACLCIAHHCGSEGGGAGHSQESFCCCLSEIRQIGGDRRGRRAKSPAGSIPENAHATLRCGPSPSVLGWSLAAFLRVRHTLTASVGPSRTHPHTSPQGGVEDQRNAAEREFCGYSVSTQFPARAQLLALESFVGLGLLDQLNMSNGAGADDQDTSGEAETAGAARRARSTRAGPDLAAAASALDGGAPVFREEGRAIEGRGARRARRESGPVSYGDGRRPPPSVDTKQKALQAICCCYRPDADQSVLKTKQREWAAEFGVDKRRFSYWEEHVDDDMIDRLRRGVVPLPYRPQGPNGEARSYAKPAAATGEADNRKALGFLHGYNLEELHQKLTARCTRVGDFRRYQI